MNCNWSVANCKDNIFSFSKALTQKHSKDFLKTWSINVLNKIDVDS